MTVKHFTASAIALLLLFATTARAQQSGTTTQSGATTTTTQTTTTQTTTPVTPAQTPPPQTVYTPNVSNQQYRNIVTGALGGAWSGDLDGGSWGFDGTYVYMTGGLGFEFIGSFTGDANLTAFDNLRIVNPLLSDSFSRSSPRVNSYMFNMVGGLPFGHNADWVPFISGGVGMFHISGGRVDLNLLDADPDFDLDFDLLDPDFEPRFDSDGLVTNFFKDNQFGGNLGVGVIGFWDQVGLRADIRYYTGMGNNEGDNLRFIAQNVGDISFWRSTVGISFRW